VSRLGFGRGIWLACWLGLLSRAAFPLSPGGEAGSFSLARPETQYPHFHAQKEDEPATSCPANIESLITLLVRDLPSYANRVIQRSRDIDRSVETYSYVLVAGNPEFEPLPLGPGRSAPLASEDTLEPPQQVFLTTLERQYQDNKAITLQHYHWLFLTQTPGGWRLAMMFTRLGSVAEGRPPLPPRETSDGVIGQAVKTWLRDCRAGVIRP
jgi:hypothetical protein